ncbi:unnamed protein product [Mytilus coruscus]|uniref:Uncharacterized protein n=1 Tax=Mytilus coruscus TaxID=42192 RepID=A0A6J8CR93_MYTCO|nr:unnamed protein product [Mytilus coruscus]
MKFKRAFAKVSEENEIGVSSSKKPCPNIDSANESKKPCFLHNFNLCTEKRLGLGVSKDSLRRYITSRCRQLEQQQRFLTSDSFVVASFDNLDKNQSYSVVGVGKDKSGFHGTTIQAVTPFPSLLTSISSAESCGTGLDDSVVPLLVGGISSEVSVITSDIDSSSCEVDLISSAVAFVDKVSTCTELSRDRSLTCDFIQSIVNPDDKIGTPRSSRGNQFENLTASYLDVTPREAASFTDFTDLVHRAETLDNLKTQLGFNRDSPHYTEMTVPYVQLQERNIDEYFSQLEQSTLFISDDKKNLHHIFLDINATDEQSDSLLNYRRYGHEDLINYVQCFLVAASSKKAPPRRRRNLITFSAPKVTVSKQKKEIKDQKTVISCLRKKIAFSKFTNKAVSDLDQFLQLPRAICDADGIPEKSLPPPPLDTDTAYIIDGMFIINTIPLSVHKTFLDYAGFLFDKWVVRPHFQFKATDVHLVFDHPNRQGTSPKDIERSRRDITDQTVEFDQLSPDTDLPSNWRSFLSVRKQKRLLVNFISDQFLTFANQKFSNSECSFITAGGFDNQFKDQARLAIANTSIEYMIASGDHEEADTRVASCSYFHCSNSYNL